MIFKGNLLNCFCTILILGLSLTACKQEKKEKQQMSGENVKSSKELSALKISENHRFFETENKPFFWLGDTGWLLFNKLDRKQAEQYLEDRKEKGFNVVQVMVIHSLNAVNVYGDSALINENIATPKTTPGADFENDEAYDFWDHVDYMVDLAEKKGIYMALVPVWGTNVKAGNITAEQAEKYAGFLAKRYKNNTNVIWLNGGDTHGDENTDVWQAIGNTLDKENPDKLITFHPFGRTQSSDWFHNEEWLDFDMFQSGHRRYDQDDSKRGYGQDNWKYVRDDYNLKPTKPIIDGEPSYEGIPQGLHDTLQPLWNDNDVRRYAYWSVFAGAAGYTYGHSAIMQMYKPEDKGGAYGNKELWTDALDAPGGKQMKYVKELMLKFPYFERVPYQEVIADQKEKYDHLLATKGDGYLMIYTYTGREIKLNEGKIPFKVKKAQWFNPRNGAYSDIEDLNENPTSFDPPEDQEDGNDWVLILTS